MFSTKLKFGFFPLRNDRVESSNMTSISDDLDKVIKEEKNELISKEYVDECMQIVVDYLNSFGLSVKAYVLKELYDKPADLSEKVKYLIDDEINYVTIEAQNKSSIVISHDDPAVATTNEIKEEELYAIKEEIEPDEDNVNHDDSYEESKDFDLDTFISEEVSSVSQSEFPCSLCERIFDSLKKLRAHQAIKHQIKANLKCDACGRKFSGRSELEKHHNIVHVLEKYKCVLCGLVFHNFHELSAHEKKAHDGDKGWACDQCDSAFKTKNHLRDHKRNIHNKKPCPTCGLMFYTERLKVHILNNHTAEHLKPHICKICKKGFGYRKKLEIHMNIHTGLKPFVCKYCGKGFGDIANMRMHERTTHEGYKRNK